MNLQIKAITSLILSLFLMSMLSASLVTSVNAQNAVDSYTVGLWHLDETNPNEYQVTTPDATGVNNGIVGVDTSNMLVEGKFDKALSFDGHNFVYVPISFLVGFPPSPQPIYIPISTNLDVQEEVRIEAWINVQGFTNATYNNIVVKCTRSDPEWENTSRVLGLSIRAGQAEDGVEVPQGTLSGFVTTDSGGFNEVVTTEPVITLNQWTHVAFERTTTGMHLYINGYEKAIKTIHGVQNPTGSIINGTEIYFGHDAKVTLDEVKISNLDPELEVVESAFDIGPNLLIAVIVVSVVFAIAWLLRRALQMIVFRSKP
jgi:hypothetical protein